MDKKSKDDIAVLLFTSGTEGMPKGVPLTHENIMSNQRGIAEATDLYKDDVIHGVLPPFHSFGFTISCLLASVLGARVAYFPNPTDGKGMAKSIEKWGVTVCAIAPTFLKGMLRTAKPDQIKNLRLVATGAEKTPPELFRMLEGLGKPNVISEGYGITECSPVLTFNRPGRPCVGVGRAAIQVEIMIVHQDTYEPMPLGSRGLILASGPGVFSGYINPGLSSPFLYIKGVRWFKTGDLGFLDEEGNLTISGRLKRFVKVGGEMISLASIEEALFEYAVSNKLPTSAEGPSIAVSAKEIDNEKPKFYVFSVFKITPDEANTALKKAGFTNLVKIAQVHQLEELPALGSGKINYRALEHDYLGGTK